MAGEPPQAATTPATRARAELPESLWRGFVRRPRSPSPARVETAPSATDRSIMSSAGIQDLTPYLIHTGLLDDRVSLNAFYLPPGTYRYTYFARATIAGRFEVPPTHAAETFFPEVFARSAGQVFSVTR